MPPKPDAVNALDNLGIRYEGPVPAGLMGSSRRHPRGDQFGELEIWRFGDWKRSDVALMRVRYRNPKSASNHERVFAFLIGSLETECP